MKSAPLGFGSDQPWSVAVCAWLRTAAIVVWPHDRLVLSPSKPAGGVMIPLGKVGLVVAL